MGRKAKTEIQELGRIAQKLERLKGIRPALSDEELETILTVMREWAITRAADELEAEMPLDKEAWKALGISGMIQEQIHREREHRQKIKQFSAGLDGRIEICWAGGDPLGSEYSVDDDRPVED